jgi:hypothetical protein
MSVRFEPVIVNGLLVKSSISPKSLDVAEPIDVASATRAERRARFFGGSPFAPVPSLRERRGSSSAGEGMLGGVADFFTVGALAPMPAVVCRGHDGWQRSTFGLFGAMAFGVTA